MAKSRANGRKRSLIPDCLRPYRAADKPTVSVSCAAAKSLGSASRKRRSGVSPPEIASSPWQRAQFWLYPEGMAVNEAGTIAITTSETTNMAHWIDTESQAIFANTLVDSRPRHAEFVKNDAEL